MELPVTWRWGVNEMGVLAHAGDDGARESLCGQAAPGPSSYHGPWFELRCKTCEQLRAGRMEVFYNPFVEEMRRETQARLARYDESNLE